VRVFLALSLRINLTLSRSRFPTEQQGSVLKYTHLQLCLAAKRVYQGTPTGQAGSCMLLSMKPTHSKETPMNALAHNIISSKVLYIGLGFGLTLISGIVLSFLGRPLNTLVFTVHKLSAVGTIVLLVLTLRTFSKSGSFQGPYQALIGAAGLILLGLFISGALLSFDRPVPQSPLRIHQILPLLALVASTMGIYFLAANRS
jgi:hypothetical protein